MINLGVLCSFGMTVASVASVVASCICNSWIKFRWNKQDMIAGLWKECAQFPKISVCTSIGESKAKIGETHISILLVSFVILA